ncbi:glycosyltransferase family 4 protein [Cryptosporangium phraense]
MYAKAIGCRTVGTLHGADFASSYKAHPNLVSRVLRSLDRTAVLDQETARILREAGFESFTVRNPAPRAHAATAPPSQSEYLLFVGEVGTRKGADVLADAWPAIHARFPDLRLRVLGPPTSYELPELPGIEMHGPQSWASAQRMISECRLLVLPSRAEVLPMVLLEAMAAGRPWISTSVGGVPLLEETRSGLIIKPGDAIALSNGCIALLESSACLDRLGEAGATAAKAAYSTDSVLARYHEIYWTPDSVRS